MSDEVPDTPDLLSSQPIPVSDDVRRRGMLFLRLAVGCVGFALALQMGLKSNFLKQVIGLSGWDLGQFEAIRETCGIVALGVLALLAGMAEPMLASSMLVLMGVGLGSYALVPDYAWLVVAGVVWSQGFHVWIPLPSAMALAMAEPHRAGYRVGQVRAANAIGASLGLAIALGVTLLAAASADSWAGGAAETLHLTGHGTAIRGLYALAGAAALLGAAACWGIPLGIKARGSRLVFRRKYMLYYALSFLEGWRKQIFAVFAGFLLVEKFHTPVHVMLVLWIIPNVIGYVSSPLVGRLIDRVGERRVLIFYFICLTAFFAVYALVSHVEVLYVVYVVDNVFFAFAIALTVYVNHIAPPHEHTQTLAVGVAMNHVAAVTMPLIGGLLWVTFGYEWTFALGASVAAGSVFVSCLVPSRDIARSTNAIPSP